MIDMMQRLTPNFKLSEFLMTDDLSMRALNREITEEQVGKLKLVAELEEQVRTILNTPLHNHSGYRCPKLNSAIGSTNRSQHMLCEAVDFDRYGLVYNSDTLAYDFQLLREAAKAGKLKFGQLIAENALRHYKDGKVVSRWLHISLGAPYRPVERCGQCLEMKEGVYTMKEIIPWA